MLLRFSKYLFLILSSLFVLLLCYSFVFVLVFFLNILLYFCDDSSHCSAFIFLCRINSLIIFISFSIIFFSSTVFLISISDFIISLGTISFLVDDLNTFLAFSKFQKLFFCFKFILLFSFPFD